MSVIFSLYHSSRMQWWRLSCINNNKHFELLLQLYHTMLRVTFFASHIDQSSIRLSVVYVSNKLWFMQTVIYDDTVWLYSRYYFWKSAPEWDVKMDLSNFCICNVLCFWFGIDYREYSAYWHAQKQFSACWTI